MNFLYDNIVHAVQNTIDSCRNSATDRRRYVLECRFTKFSEITQCNGRYAVQGHSRSNVTYVLLLLILSLSRDMFRFQQIVNELLGRYNKRLDTEQMASLLAKQSSENPLWLSIACEELRVFGQFRELSDKINDLADGLLE